MGRLEYAYRLERNRQDQRRASEEMKHKLAIRLKAKRMIAIMNRDVIDPNKVIYDPVKNQWRMITEQERQDNLRQKMESMTIQEENGEKIEK
jgi:hypothetical protein